MADDKSFTDAYRAAELEAQRKAALQESAKTNAVHTSQEEDEKSDAGQPNEQSAVDDHSRTASAPWEPFSNQYDSEGKVQSTTGPELRIEESRSLSADDVSLVQRPGKNNATEIIHARADEDLHPIGLMSEEEWEDLVRRGRPPLYVMHPTDPEHGKTKSSNNSARQPFWLLAIGLGLLFFLATFMVLYAWLSKR